MPQWPYTESVDKTVEWLSANSVDMIFMDIHLSDGSAFMIFNKTEVTTPMAMRGITPNARVSKMIEILRIIANADNCISAGRRNDTLSRSEQRIERVRAYDTGFANVTYFNRLFRNKYNRTPKSVRTENNNDTH